ncbi:MAG: hypothetical protein Q7S03_03870 [bacterium]|nr:hypothetical protein [bacterium]
MDSRKYHVNPLAVVFHPGIDKTNGYTSLVANPETDEQFVINKLRYFILETIDENPGIEEGELFEKVKVRVFPDPIKEDISKILEFFVKERIINES